MNKNKKIIIAIGVTAIVLAIGATIYFQKSKPPEVSTALPEEINEGLFEERIKNLEDIKAIRNFRTQPELKLVYTETRPHATQFGIGKEVKRENTYYYETPDKYKIPVRVYQEKKMIGDGCQVFEYEVDAKTHKVVEM